MITVSKATKHHCTGTVQSHGGRVGNVKQVGFEPRPEDSYRRCRSDSASVALCTALYKFDYYYYYYYYYYYILKFLTILWKKVNDLLAIRSLSYAKKTAKNMSWLLTRGHNMVVCCEPKIQQQQCTVCTRVVVITMAHKCISSAIKVVYKSYCTRGKNNEMDKTTQSHVKFAAIKSPTSCWATILLGFGACCCRWYTTALKITNDILTGVKKHLKSSSSMQ